MVSAYEWRERIDAQSLAETDEFTLQSDAVPPGFLSIGAAFTIKSEDGASRTYRVSEITLAGYHCVAIPHAVSS